MHANDDDSLMIPSQTVQGHLYRLSPLYNYTKYFSFTLKNPKLNSKAVPVNVAFSSY